MKKTLSGTPIKKQGKSVNWQVENPDSNDKQLSNNQSPLPKEQSPVLNKNELL